MVSSSSFLIGLIQLFSATTVLCWKHSSEAQFQSMIKEHDLVLVAFVAPWTEPSKALESEWLSATKKSEEWLISVDCTKEKALCTKYNVISYPAIRLFQGDKVTRYRGPRKSSSIIPFLHRSKLPTISVLDSSNITTFPSLDPAGVFIAHLPPSSSNSLLLTIFSTLARTHHTQYTFGLSTSSSLASSLGRPVPSVIYQNALTSTSEIFSGAPTLQELSLFITTSTAPTIGEFTRKSEISYLKAGKSIVYLFHSTPTQQAHLLRTLEPLARKYKEYLNFVTVDVKEYGHIPSAMGLSESKEEAVAVFNPMYGQKFPFAKGGKGITEMGVEGLVMNIVQGKVKPWDGSESERVGGGGKKVVHDEM